MSSVFDPDVFMSTEVKDQLDTRLIPADEGEYNFSIDKVAAKKITAKDGVREFIVLEANCTILDEEVKKKTGLDRPQARISMFLDLNENGTLDTGRGKNVKLGQLRDALGMNKSGKAWSPSHMVGMTAWGRVRQRADENDPTIIRNEITAFSSSPSEREERKTSGKKAA